MITAGASPRPTGKFNRIHSSLSKIQQFVHNQYMTKHNKRVVALVINIAIILMEIYALTLTIKDSGLGIFKYYTDNSNILALIASISYSIFLIRALKNPKLVCPSWLKYLKLFSVCVLSITFAVVLFILAPLSGGLATWFMLFYGSMLFHHFLCPLISLLSFVFFEADIKLTFKDTFFSLIPTLTYAIIILILNIIKRMIGPYQFFHIYEQSIWMTLFWCVIIFSFAYLIALLLFFAKKKTRKTSFNSFHSIH